MDEIEYLGATSTIQSYNLFTYCEGNPVNMVDESGTWHKMSTIFTVIAIAAVAVAAVAAIVVSCGTATPAAGCGVAASTTTGAITAVAAIGNAAATIAKKAVVAATVSGITKKTLERNNSVYVLKDESGTVQYVARTNNIDKRRVAHNYNPERAGLVMEVIATGLNLPESRALEQSAMVYYHTINTANKMNNQINSVSPKKWNIYKEIAVGTLRYGWNQMSNEILYWTNN